MSTHAGGRPSRPRITAVVIAIVAVLGLGFGVVRGYSALDDQYQVQVKIDTAWCRTEPHVVNGKLYGSSFWDSTPAAFATGTASTGPYVDTKPYLMPAFSTVSFPSRDAGVTIQAWWIPGSKQDGPAVILAHGRGKCRGDPEVLLPAGMLHRAGFGVLLVDLRNHGGSTVTDGRHTWGVHESQDMLGAWDWLDVAQKVPTTRIGLYGVSLGGATALIAMGREPRAAAVFEDSAFASLDEAIRDDVSAKGLPEFSGPPLAFLLRTVHGIDISPLDGAARLGGRPIAIVHGTADAIANLRYALLLADVATRAGSKVDPWILPGVAHVRAAFVATAEYERRLDAFFVAALGKP